MSKQQNLRAHAIPWVHGMALKPTLDFLKDRDVRTDRLLERNFRSPEPLDTCRDVLPQHVVGNFISGAARLGGLPNIGHEAAIHIRSTGAEWTYARPGEPTVYAALQQAFARMKAHTSTPFEVVLNDFGASVFRYQTALSNEAEFHFGCFGIETVIDIVRSYVEPQWTPTKLWVPGRIAEIPRLSTMFPFSRIHSSSNHWRFDIPKSALAALPRHAYAPEQIPTAGPDLFEEPLTDTCLRTVFDRILRTYLRRDPIDLQICAEILHTSPRTLQRRLTESGLTFSAMLDAARFTVASEMLKETERPIIEIAQALGFESSSNFSRSFRRVSGVSPREYRRALVKRL